MNKIPLLSFFSGGGFLDMGFELAGFEIIWSNEFDKAFAELHSSGITSWRKSQGNRKKAEIFNTKSITEVTSLDICNEAFPFGQPKIWGIIGGPPCQDFTLNGNLNGFNGERGKMTIIYFDKIKELKPTFFLMENVPGLFHFKDNRKILYEIVRDRCYKDYFLDQFILNALNYGVPQNRERIFLVGLRKDAFTPPLRKILFDSLFTLNFKPPAPKYDNARVKFSWPGVNLFGDIPDKPMGIPEELFVANCLVNEQDIVNNTPNINEFFPLIKDPENKKGIQEGNTLRQSFKRLHRYRYSPTACYGNNEVHLHPYENRRISVREALRIQGVPDSYVLPPNISLTKKFKMIGNGVPVPLAEAVAKSLMELITKTKIKNMDIWSIDKRHDVMSRIRSKNTKPELLLRSELFKKGYRYRLHVRKLPGNPDIVLSKYKTLIFVNGCFWHQHRECGEGRIPDSNKVFWEKKLLRNVENDEKFHIKCKELGWRVIVVWECELERDLDNTIDKILKIIREQPILVN